MKRGSLLKMSLVYIALLLVFNNEKSADDRAMYNITEIPVDLLADADAVVRDFSLVFKVENEEKATLIYTYAVTILNKQGQHFGKLRLPYDRFSKIKDLKGRLYDANGKKIRELDDDEIKDNAIISWAKLYSDRRCKSADLYHNQFPYTVEFIYKEECDGYINWRSWKPEEEDASIQHSSYEIILPKELDIRYRCYNWNIEPKVIPREDDYVSYCWETANLKPFKKEPIGPPSGDQYKAVITAPGKFKMDDYEGDLTTWQNFGLWSKTLWEGKQNLNPETVAEINSLLKPGMDRKETIKVLYKYLQSKTRYVDLNAGIGGWQPIDAQKVHECGYGDCKALSNYMVALLDAAGIQSYPVLIESNSKPERLEKSFSRNQFNHVIVCVPEEADTVWLECTSQSLPCGYLGCSTENRFGLLISENGGELVKTPSSSAIINKKVTNAAVKLDDGSAEVSIKYWGNESKAANYYYHYQSSDAYDEWIKYELDIPSVKITDKNISQADGDPAYTVLEAEVSANNFATTMGSRLFFSPCFISKGNGVPKELEERKYPLVFSYPYSEIDTVVYTLPANTELEAKPEDVNIESDYYKFTSEVSQVDSSTITFVRHFEIKVLEMPAEMYNSYRELMQAIVQSDSRKIVLKTN